MFERMGEYHPVWSDEFDYEGAPDPGKWGYDLGNHQWANRELQAYTDRPGNVFVKDGKLVIRALKEQDGERAYTSARLTTYGKQSWQYGYFEIRAKLPGGRGSWPAFWFLADSIRQGTRWPLCGEIDMMEHTVVHKDVLVYSLHSAKHNHTRRDTVQYSTSVPQRGVCEEFHVYGMEWTPDYVEYFFDDVSVCKYRRTDDAEDQTEQAWPYDQPFYMILNIAVGGFMGGDVADGDLPYTMEVDYVRVYQK
ncbi:MAG: glycoside hydrolase family 16 protein [bacterium]|nr:glycoside hydrolase family 16 protein [bacterium]